MRGSGQLLTLAVTVTVYLLGIALARAAKVAEFNAMWQYPYFRHVIRLITVVWGVAYTGEFLLGVVVASTLPIPIVVAISPVVFAAITVATILWIFAYARWARQRD
jgi:hypothetical protein